MNDGLERMGRREWFRRVAGAIAGVTAATAAAMAASPESDSGATAGITASADGERTPRKKPVGKVASRQAVACVGCERCMPCGYGVDIPGNFSYYNTRLADGAVPDLKDNPASAEFRKVALGYLRGYDKAIPDSHQSQRCIKCFQCVAKCPKGVSIVNELAAMTDLADSLRDWECRYL